MVKYRLLPPAPCAAVPRRACLPAALSCCAAATRAGTCGCLPCARAAALPSAGCGLRSRIWSGERRVARHGARITPHGAIKQPRGIKTLAKAKHLIRLVDCRSGLEKTRKIASRVKYQTASALPLLLHGAAGICCDKQAGRARSNAASFLPARWRNVVVTARRAICVVASYRGATSLAARRVMAPTKLSI